MFLSGDPKDRDQGQESPSLTHIKLVPGKPFGHPKLRSTGLLCPSVSQAAGVLGGKECEEGVMIPHMLREDPLLREAEASCVPHVASHCARA